MQTRDLRYVRGCRLDVPRCASRVNTAAYRCEHPAELFTVERDFEHRSTETTDGPETHRKERVVEFRFVGALSWDEQDRVAVAALPDT